MLPPKISIIILQFNNSEDTMRCLESVRELAYPNYNVIIIDNASDVDDLNDIRFFIESTEYPRFALIVLQKNVGYAGGNNVGIKQALENITEYVLILNPDTIIEKDALTKLIEAGESDPGIGILGPAINENGKIIYGGKISWLKPELEHSQFYPNPRVLNASQYVIGATMLIKKEVLDKIGLFDERYFLYFEDADFCRRAARAGYKFAIVPGAVVHHRPSSSTSSLGRAFLLRYHYRNAHLFNWKNGPLWAKLVLPFWSFFIIIKQLLKIIFVSAKREISEAILAGVIDFYKGKFGKINA